MKCSDSRYEKEGASWHMPMTLPLWRRPKDVEFNVEGHVVIPQKEMKYLGITIDRGLTFGMHVNKDCGKTERTASALMRLMPHVGEARPKRRKLLVEVVHSAIRVASAYRTVSTDAILVVAAMIPIDLRVLEREAIFKAEGDKKAAREEQKRVALSKWQARGQETRKAAWTRELISDIGVWALTGHESFKTYLKRIQKAHGDRYCGETDTPEHTLFRCEKRATVTTRMNAEVGDEVTKRNLIQLACAARGRLGRNNGCHDSHNKG
ncbi:hypothetical protein NQ315_002637 [Exocentrus adspersus]|uniref:Reverse transcriptase n=1 Tax=Exocentrus adspersus TaxID=1586481 RepID=A0AAV8VUA4_9CUCU|nr:hypothetical protein NQ315_002637 [Exocentrus adspersus]